MNYLLYYIILAVLLLEIFILYYHKLSNLELTYLTIVIVTQLITICSLYKKQNNWLIISHIIFGASLFVGALSLTNKYLLALRVILKI